MRLSQVMLTAARGLGVRAALGSAPRSDLYARERDKLWVTCAVFRLGSRDQCK